MTEIPIIDQTISTVAPVKHRDTINPTIPATQDAFVQSAEAFFDKISDTTVNELNQVTTKIDTTVAAINVVAQEISEAATIAIASGQYKGDWVAGFETIGYSLGDGVTFTDGYNYVSKINNNLTTPITLTNTDQWNFIEAVNPNNYYLKTETYTKTEVDTLHEINNKTDKTTPINTDNFLIEEIEGLFKKLSWANLKTALSSFFMNLTSNQIIAGNKNFTGNLLMTGASSVIGYGTGSGGNVVQLTSKTTTVTLNKPTGKITTSNSALAAGATAVFIVSNSFFDGAKDIFNITSTTFSFNYVIRVYYAGTGSVQIEIKNNIAGSLSDSIDINFAIIKGANS